MSQKVKYKFYATLLDGFNDYLNADTIYSRYWGFSENPPHTEEEFREQKFNDFIDRINRVPFDSEAADRGTAFNEVVDCIKEKRKSKIMDIESNPDTEVITAVYNERIFTFNTKLCKWFATYFKDAVSQYFTKGVLPTRLGDVELYGYIDELPPHTIHDIKTTGKYSAFKYKDNFQHLVYPYCLSCEGIHIPDFEYTVTDFKEIFTESYTFVPNRDIPRLQDHCEELITFLEDNRDLIINNKVFALDE